MFGGGFLGVGPAEIFVIGAVGWLVLGPQRLFQVARDAGKVLGQLRKTADDAKGSFTEALEVDSLGLGSLSDPLGLGSSLATTKARKVQEREEQEERERASAGSAASGGKEGPVAGAADVVAAAVSTEPAGPAPAPATAGAPVASTATATAPLPAATVGSAVPEELVRKPDQKAGEDELAHFREQLRRVSDPKQTADLYVVVWGGGDTVERGWDCCCFDYSAWTDWRFVRCSWGSLLVAGAASMWPTYLTCCLLPECSPASVDCPHSSCAFLRHLSSHCVYCCFRACRCPCCPPTAGIALQWPQRWQRTLSHRWLATSHPSWTCPPTRRWQSWRRHTLQQRRSCCARGWPS